MSAMACAKGFIDPTVKGFEVKMMLELKALSTPSQCAVPREVERMAEYPSVDERQTVSIMRMSRVSICGRRIPG